MSALDRSEPRTLPRLVEGQRLDQSTFHERYEAMPPNVRAELVGGLVYMPSPLLNDHGEADDNTSLWLGFYRLRTPGLRGSANASTILGAATEVQPDHQLRIPPERGGLTRIVDGYVRGAPELVVEVAWSSRDYDLGEKKGDYEHGGVPEYLVIEVDPDRIHWFALRDGRFVARPADLDGIFRSEVFPGLWLDPRPFFAGDMQGVIATLERGLATPEHAAFVARLAAPGLE